MKRKKRPQNQKLEQLKRVHNVRRLVVQDQKPKAFLSRDKNEAVEIYLGKSDEPELVVESGDIKKALREINKKGRVIDLRKEAVEKAKQLIVERQQIESTEEQHEEQIVEQQEVSIQHEGHQNEPHAEAVETAPVFPAKSHIAPEPGFISANLDQQHTAEELPVQETVDEAPLQPKQKKRKKQDVEPGLSYQFWLWPRKMQRSIAVFTVLCLIFSFSIKSFAGVTDIAYETKDSVLGNAQMAYEFATSASDSLTDKDFSMAEYKFAAASERFFASKQEIDSLANGVDSVLALIPGGTQVNAAENLLEAGGHLSIAGGYIANALEPFSEADDIFQALKDQKDEQIRETEFDQSQKSLTEALSHAKVNLEKALVEIEDAEAALEKVNTDKLPDDIKDKVQFLKDQMPQLTTTFRYFMSYADMILIILGHDSLKRYLVLFQNNSEIRPTGGFIGTYAKIDLNEGKITRMIVEGPYSIDGQLKDKIHAPEALRLINNRFFMRDANWFADFPTSAEKASELYEKSGGPTVDGVISLNAEVLVDLLKLVGPVDMPEYEVTITHENFFEETQREVEISYDKELNRPKKFVSDLIPRVLEKMLELEQAQWIDGLRLFASMMEGKDMMIYFKNPEIQQEIIDMGWSGEVKETEKDYLNIVHANIGGGKTDRVIKQKAKVETEIQSDGSVVNTVTLTRTHNGDPNDFWTRVKNVTYTRFYVPEGSELIEAKGFDSELYEVLVEEDSDAYEDQTLAATEGNSVIDPVSKTRSYTETGKAVFGNFIGVEAGMTKVVQVKYRIPTKVALSPTNPVSHYSMLFQKQSGAKPMDIEYVISYPLMYLATWQYLTDSMPERKFRRLEADFLLNKDKAFAVVFSQ